MRLFGELELMLTTVANAFLLSEKKAGRMSVGSIAKVTKHWHDHNRPQVIEFRFDFVTQLMLVQLNKDTFRFQGAHSEKSLHVCAMLNGWRSVARELGIRTFCTPDSDIRKMLHDSFRILEMLGAPPPFLHLWQRLQSRAFKAMIDMAAQRQRKKDIAYGVTKEYVPNETAYENGAGMEGYGENGVYTGYPA